MHFAWKLADYSGEVRMDHRKKATYHLHWAVERWECLRVLEWFVPEEGVLNHQEMELERVVNDGAEIGVAVMVFRVSP